METDLRAAEVLKAEFRQANTDASKQNGIRQDLTTQTQTLSQGLQRAHADLQQLPTVRNENESLWQEIQRARTVFEFEKKANNERFEQRQVVWEEASGAVDISKWICCVKHKLGLLLLKWWWGCRASRPSTVMLDLKLRSDASQRREKILGVPRPLAGNVLRSLEAGAIEELQDKNDHKRDGYGCLKDEAEGEKQPLVVSGHRRSLVRDKGSFGDGDLARGLSVLSQVNHDFGILLAQSGVRESAHMLITSRSSIFGHEQANEASVSLPDWSNILYCDKKNNENVFGLNIAEMASFLAKEARKGKDNRRESMSMGMEEDDAVWLKGKVALVIGASSSLRRMFSLALATHGCHVIIAARRVQLLHSFLQHIHSLSTSTYSSACEQQQQRQRSGKAAIVELVDVSNSEVSVDACVENAWNAFGKIDILVNNAGFRGTVKSSLELEENEWNKVMATNLRGVWLVPKSIGRYIVEELQAVRRQHKLDMQVITLVNDSNVGTLAGCYYWNEEVGSRIKLMFTPVDKDDFAGISKKVVSVIVADAEPVESYMIFKPELEGVGYYRCCECIVSDAFGRLADPVTSLMALVASVFLQVYSGGKEAERANQWFRAMAGRSDLIPLPGKVGRMTRANMDNLVLRLMAKLVLVVRLFNAINGDLHDGNELALKVFRIFPVGIPSFKELIKTEIGIYGNLKNVIKKDHGLTTPKHVVGVVEDQKICKTLLLKTNESGSVTESVEDVKMAEWAVTTGHSSMIIYFVTHLTP